MEQLGQPEHRHRQPLAGREQEQVGRGAHHEPAGEHAHLADPPIEARGQRQPRPLLAAAPAADLRRIRAIPGHQRRQCQQHDDSAVPCLLRRI